jgi:hypothetical protein
VGKKKAENLAAYWFVGLLWTASDLFLVETGGIEPPTY